MSIIHYSWNFLKSSWGIYLFFEIQKLKFFKIQFNICSLLALIDTYPAFCWLWFWYLFGILRASIFTHIVHLVIASVVLAYQTNEGKPYVLKVVKEAEQRISKDFTLTHEYLPIDGLAAFTDASTAVMFGKESPLVVNRKVRFTLLNWIQFYDSFSNSKK